MKIMTINDVNFEVQKEVITLPIVNYHPHRTIWDCYARPSSKKIAIYEDWLRYAISVNAQAFTVSSYNRFFFTLQIVFRYEGIKYLAYITYAHNYLYRMTE